MTKTEKLSRSLTRVALPIAAQSLISSSLSLIDNLMVGSLGETELSAVGLSSQVFFVFWMLINGFTSGTATYMAQFWGKKDLHNIRRVIGIAVTISASLGMLFFLAGTFAPGMILRIFTDIPEVIDLGVNYIRAGAPCFLFISIIVPLTTGLRATQQTKLPLITASVAFMTNTFLNYILIFGSFGFPQLGVTGAALATSIARCIEMSLVLYVIFGRKNPIAGPIKSFFDWHKELFTRVVRNSVPTTINESMWGLGTALYNAAYGRMGVTAFAAIQASGTIQNLFIMACFSLGDALLILVGEQLGKGEYEVAYKLSARILKISVVIGIIAGALLLASSQLIIGLFDFTPKGMEYTRIIIMIYSAFMFVKVYNVGIVTGILRAGGDTRFAMFTDMGCVWLIGVPAAFIGALWLHLPVYIVVLMVQFEEAIKAFITTYRFKSKKWVKNLVNTL